ncbi:MAG TPA: MFS transporter [Jatrophihabitans sp.]|jgi:MFS family permease
MHPVIGRHHLRAALRLAGFRRLFGVRLVGQFADGVFQLSLAGAVLFNPERQASAADVAAGFAVLLLPYSLIGPFAGVLLDRWWRQRVLVWTSVARALAVIAISAEIAIGVHGLAFYASALVVMSTSRFFLSALSAALPHVVGPDELVTANALSTTFGALATTAGGGVAVLLRALFGGPSAGSYATVAAISCLPYAVSGLLATGFGRRILGPDDVQRAGRETVREIAHGLVAGGRHLKERRPALLALGAIGVHRLCYGLFAVCTVLLFRNRFTPDGPLRVGLPGLAQVVVVIAIGGGLAALCTPTATRRIGFTRWSAALLAASGVIQLGLVLTYQLPVYLLAALLLGFCAQGLKISVDTIVQYEVADEFRGRVFALYDMLFNVALVTAALLTALILPADGYAPVSVVLIGLAYLATSACYTRLTGGTGSISATAASTSV